ncbi:MAG: hypothetical protein HGA31_02815 [Candidatus Moranbacteria bacterium]|nr:hypothetical protein [Candidatus Moranbacteria bacterium]
MIKTKSVRELPTPDDGRRIYVPGFEGRFGQGIFFDLILPSLAFDEEAFLLRPSCKRLRRYGSGADTWQSFTEMYRWELCHSDAAYRELGRYAASSKERTVTFLDMCETPEKSLRKIAAEMCGCIISSVDIRIE